MTQLSMKNCCGSQGSLRDCDWKLREDSPIAELR
jgi:hypothetical protein